MNINSKSLHKNEQSTKLWVSVSIAAIHSNNPIKFFFFLKNAIFALCSIYEVFHLPFAIRAKFIVVQIPNHSRPHFYYTSNKVFRF